jgi:hypothetical protein
MFLQEGQQIQVGNKVTGHQDKLATQDTWFIINSLKGHGLGKKDLGRENAHHVVDPNPKESQSFGWIRIRKKRSDTDPDTVVE